MRRRPVIGVSGPDLGGWPAWIFTRLAVRLAGGRALRLTPAAPDPAEPLDGLILGGGADVDPELYGESPEEARAADELPEVGGRGIGRYLRDLALGLAAVLLRKLLRLRPNGTGRTDPLRDELETRLLVDALRRGLPVLGICRGAQLLNVHLGGTLYTDLADFYLESPHIQSVLPRKRVLVAPGSRLERAMGLAATRVNAMHRQAVRGLGEGLVVAAREECGVVQAVEHAARPFVVGVQWHPEYLPQLPSQRRLFRALVRAARGARTARAGR